MDTDALSNVTVYLCFSGYDGDPTHISDILSMTPTSVHKMGEHLAGRSVPISRSFWTTLLLERPGLDVGEVIEAALTKLEKKSDAIVSVQERTKHESCIGVTVAMGSSKPSINIGPDALRFIATMNLNLDIGLFD